MSARAIILAAGLAIVAGPASTQELAGFGATAMFDWPAIDKCARQAKPAAPKHAGQVDWFDRFQAIHRIQTCRLILAAREAGWTESGARRVNPFPPAPMHNPNDGKE